MVATRRTPTVIAPTSSDESCSAASPVSCAEQQISLLNGASSVLEPTSSPDTIYCRDRQLASLRSFVRRRIESKTSGAVFVSGSPGTGKTCCVDHVVDEVSSTCRSVVRLNGMQLSSTIEMFQLIGSALGMTDKQVGTFPSVAGMGGYWQIVEMFLKSVKRHNKATVIVIDEIDQLLKTPPGFRSDIKESTQSRCQSALAALLGFALSAASKTILISIANAVSMFDSLKPAKSSEVSERFLSIIFEPYTLSELRTIVEGRLASVTSQYETGHLKPVFEKTALELCIRKVATACGDCRLVLDACHRTVAAVADKGEQEYARTKRRPDELGEETLVTSKRTKVEVTDEACDASLMTCFSSVGAKDVQDVLNACHQSSNTQNQWIISGLPLHQKLFLCAACNVSAAKNQQTNLELSAVQKAYRDLCSRRNISFPVGNFAMNETLGGLESNGLLDVIEAPRRTKKGASMGDRKLQLRTASEQVREILAEISTGLEALLD